MSKKIILVTGGNAGLGFECCLQLAKRPKTHVILAGCSEQRVGEAVAKIKSAASPSSIVEAGIVNLASLASVRDFVKNLNDHRLPIFSIVCNAGMQVSKKELTVDGFETTFGVNHLGHFLLAELLRKQTKRIVMLTSYIYDPAEKNGMPVPNATNLNQLARGYDTFDPMEAYSTSKLLNLVFTKEFACRYPDRPKIFAYSPGFTPETSLFREQHWLAWMIQNPIYKFFTWLGGGRITMPEYSGGYMAKLAAKEPLTPSYATGAYVRVDEPWEVKAQATDRNFGEEL